MAFGASYTLERRLQWKLAPCFLFFFYSNINIAGQYGYILHLRGVISFPRFSDGVFNKIQWGWGLLDGVSVKRMGLQWGWMKAMGLPRKSMGSTFNGDVTGGRTINTT